MIRCRTSRPNAEAVARALTAAEQGGQAGHGMRRLPSYAAQALSGKVDGRATPASRPGRPGVLTIDACNGFAYPALDLAVDWLAVAAPRQGIAAAGITRSHHCGVAGITVERLANAGLVAMMFANTPAAVAPWGGRKPMFGTNPIAFAAPRLKGQAPIVIDVSLSKVARGKIMAAGQRGEPIPMGWALDQDGQPTTDPQAALSGSMVPLGDAKGTALALMVELLAAGLVGAHFGHEASSFLSADGPPPGVGQMILAIDAAAFSPPDLNHIGDLVAALDQGRSHDDRLGAGGASSGLHRIEDMAAAIEAEPGARLPGTRRLALREKAAQHGIAIDGDLLANIRAVGRMAES
ncbi:MAG: Ldh family oxidoreductase [Paracoccus sp. (in: a-proteobacteria)]|nr:Ldh family oxidoreductase [Paracoccus sp. (in: a-proteobacteria)]